MKHIETKLIQGGKQFNKTASVITPIYQTSTYHASPLPEEYLQAATEARYPEFYHRHGNPTNSQAAEIIAELEGTEACLLTSTGMSAISTALFASVLAGDHIIAQTSHYSASKILLTQLLPDYGVETTFVDATDAKSFAAAVRPNTKVIYLETPANPNLTLVDLAAITKIAQENQILTICDNTFASPINQNPKLFGIDVVVHSATKYLGGHSDLTAGAICGTEEFVNFSWKRLLSLGGSLAPFDSWLLLRGLRTLSLRVNQINQNAQQLAEWFETHPRIAKVQYCGLPSHPQHELAKRQMRGFTGMMTIEIKGENEAEQFRGAQGTLNNLKIFANAASLGGVESLVVHPASMWGMQHSPAQKALSGINDGMLRISVGIEHVDDLISDFEYALNQSFEK